LVLAVIVIAFRPLTIWAFNSDFGKLLGMKTGRWQLLMMSLVSIHAVLSFESVGAIMVVGMLVLPAATAYLISNKLIVVLCISGAIGILGCVVGFFVALWLNVSIAPTIVSICGVFFTIIWSLQWLRGERKVIQTSSASN